MRLLAETEGIFTETAGGVTLGAAIKLIQGGQIGKDDGPVVICVTGNGMKTQDPLVGKLPEPALIGPRLGDFDESADQRPGPKGDGPTWPPFVFRRRFAS